MKYQIVINQAGVVAAELQGKTDLTDWAILGHVYSWQANSRAERNEKGKVWINYGNLMDELPLIGLNSKGAVSNRVDKLRELQLIETEQAEDGRLFAKTTPLYETVAEYRAIPQRGVHGNERGVHQTEQGPVHGGEQYPNTISYPTIAPHGADGGANPNQENLTGQNAGNPQGQGGDQSEKKPRKPDPVWDAVISACGMAGAEPTKSERSAWNTAVNDIKQTLKKAGIETPEGIKAEVARRAEAFTKKWKTATLTPTALARRWNEVVAVNTGKQTGGKPLVL